MDESDLSDEMSEADASDEMDESDLSDSSNCLNGLKAEVKYTWAIMGQDPKKKLIFDAARKNDVAALAAVCSPPKWCLAEAMFISIKRNSVECVAWLLEHGVDPNIVDSDLFIKAFQRNDSRLFDLIGSKISQPFKDYLLKESFTRGYTLAANRLIAVGARP